MRVQSNSVQNYYNNVLHYTNPTTRGTQKQADNFAELLGSTANEDLPAAKELVKSTSGNQTELSPSDIYESMTMQESPANHSTSRNILGVNWTDEKLATLAGIKYGVTVDTTKTINWESTGDQQLTAEQRSELKEKYDVKNLDPQSYYDLMSDLTHMNVLSAKDIEGMHLKKIDLGPGNFMITPDSVQSGFRNQSFSMGNILDTLKNELDYLGRNQGWSMTDDFLNMNPAFAKDGALERYTGLLGEQSAYLGKLQNIFASIQR